MIKYCIYYAGHNINNSNCTCRECELDHVTIANPRSSSTFTIRI